MINGTSATAQPQVDATHATAPAPRPTDDEILGLETRTKSPALETQGQAESDPFDFDASEAEAAGQTGSSREEPAQYRAIFEANPELAEAWRESQSFRDIFPNIETAREIQKLFPTLNDARAADAQVADLARLDTLFFSNRPESHAELAAAIYRLNPAAFRSLAHMMHSISTDSGSASKVSPGNENLAAAALLPDQAPRTNQVTAPQMSADEPIHSDAATSPVTAAHEHAFFHETNAAAVEGVLNSIQSQLDRILPEGTPKNARQRLTGEIYRELDTALQGNRAFGQQLREAFRSGQLTPENQRAIVGMVVGRARQALPGIAKRVLGEWTSGVVAHANSRHERQRNAAKRIDIAGGAPGGDGPRSLMPKDIDYRRMSDSDILNL